MKKFYETPVVEFAGFNVGDVITISEVFTSRAEFGDEAAAKFEARVAENAATTGISAAVSYSSYNW